MAESIKLELMPAEIVRLEPDQCLTLKFAPCTLEDVALLPEEVRGTAQLADGVIYHSWIITDPDTLSKKWVPAMTLKVTEIDGTAVKRYFRVIQKRLAAVLIPLAESGVLFERKIKICRHGKGYTAEYTVELL